LFGSYEPSQYGGDRMIVLEWLNSLNNWQQAIVGIPYSIIIAFIFLIIFKELKVSRGENDR
jgi:hypothetical protein